MPPRLAFVFPGQGSQYVGMGRALYERFPEARAIFEEADRRLGYALSRLCFEGPEEQLNDTFYTQPALLTVSIAAYEAWRTRGGLPPDWVAGHSLGSSRRWWPPGPSRSPTPCGWCRSADDG